MNLEVAVSTGYFTKVGAFVAILSACTTGINFLAGDKACDFKVFQFDLLICHFLSSLFAHPWRFFLYSNH